MILIFLSTVDLVWYQLLDCWMCFSMIENGISASEDKIVGKRFESFYWISIYNIYALLFNYSLFTLESNTLTHLWICCDI